MFVTVTEKWSEVHSKEAGNAINAKCIEMTNAGTLTKMVYDKVGAPTKTFTTQDAANDYIAFCSNLNPTSMTVNTHETEDLLNQHLASIGTETPPVSQPFAS
jgi:hypothetical protein